MWDSRTEADRWLKQAENDLEFARLGLREGFFAQVCFLAQQSAEKAVKAIGYLHGLIKAASECARHIGMAGEADDASGVRARAAWHRRPPTCGS